MAHTPIPDEAVQAFMDSYGSEGGDDWDRTVFALEAALPHLPRPTLLLSDDDRDPPKAMLLARIRELEDALSEALTDWEDAAGYKGEYLREKHGDLERIAEFRALLPDD